MKRLIYFILGLLVASCYDDKENYTYQEVNTLDVSLNKVYSVRLDKDTTVTNIRGCIRQPIIILTDMASSTRLDWNRI